MKAFQYKNTDWSPLRSGNDIGGGHAELVLCNMPTQYVILQAWRLKEQMNIILRENRKEIISNIEYKNQ